MIHDVLLGMLGFTGEIIEYSDKRLVLSSGVSLERFDADIVDGLLELGSMYVEARDWAESVRLSPTSSVYELVIAKCLEEGLLDEYETAIAEFEKLILDLDGSMTLCTLRLELWERFWASFEVVTKQLLAYSGENMIDHALGLCVHIRNEHLSSVAKALIASLSRELVSWCKYAVIPGGARSKFFVRENQGGSALIDQIGKFQIDKARIPQRLVSLEVCNKVLFCGRTVIVLQNGDPTKLIAADFSFLKTPIPNQTHLVPEFITSEIERLRKALSRLLADRMKRESEPNLRDHFERLRGLFLLGYGQRWVTLLEEAGSDAPAKLAQQFTISFAEYSGVRLSATRELAYELPWPTELVVSPSALVKYQQIFDVLFRVLSASVRARYAYNRQISNVLTGLTSYFQLDLIETAYAELIQVTESQDDIQEIALAHELFLNTVHTGCLVGVENIWKIINAIIALGEELTRDRHEAGEVMDLKIETQVKALVKELESLQVRPTYASIARLILKIDFNNFYRGTSLVIRDS